MTDDPLRPHDRQLLARVAAGNDWLRSVLCTLARHGTSLRHEDPARAEELVTLLTPWPWFKAGQFLFDLLEWEDFMVDGHNPPALPTVLQPENWERLDALLASVRALVDAAQPASGASVPAGVPGIPGLVPSISAMVDRFTSDAELPPLEPGLHLYRDVVLGVWMTAAVDRPGSNS